jgi:hypothetical protein
MPEKPAYRARVAAIFFANALNIGFFLCYFRRRVEIVRMHHPRWITQLGDLYGEKECSTDQV